MGDNINWGQLYLANDGDVVVAGPAKDLRCAPRPGWPGAPSSDSNRAGAALQVSDSNSRPLAPTRSWLSALGRPGKAALLNRS